MVQNVGEHIPAAREAQESFDDTGLMCLVMIAGYYRIPADVTQLQSQLVLSNHCG